jgi:hypothetical protein
VLDGSLRVIGFAGVGCRHAQGGFSAISTLVQSWIDKGHYPWAVLRVYQGEKIIYAGHWGCYNQADNIANIASGTKVLETATVLTVVDEGKIKLDAPCLLSISVVQEQRKNNDNDEMRNVASGEEHDSHGRMAVVCKYDGIGECG